jgi:hypothetical protein
MDEIKINCKAADTLDIQDMTLFQGELKTRTDSDYEHIKKSILDYGFCAPFFIWEHDGINSVLDGTGRYETLQRMKSEGYDIPLLPVAYIDCKDEATAKKVLLQINSHNGTMTVDSVRDFLGDVEFNFGDITLPDSGALDFEEDAQPIDLGFVDEGETMKDALDHFDITLTFDKKYEIEVSALEKKIGKTGIVNKIIQYAEEER